MNRSTEFINKIPLTFFFYFLHFVFFPSIFPFSIFLSACIIFHSLFLFYFCSFLPLLKIVTLRLQQATLNTVSTASSQRRSCTTSYFCFSNLIYCGFIPIYRSSFPSAAIRQEKSPLVIPRETS